jgi:hypothetical protein
MSFSLLTGGATGKIVYPSAALGLPSPTAFSFAYPARQFPAFSMKRYGKDTLSGAGKQQSMTQFVDIQFAFEVPWVPSADAVAWFNFCLSAIQRTPFDFYPDSTQAGFVTCILMNDAADLLYQGPGRYKLQSLKLRQFI